MFFTPVLSKNNHLKNGKNVFKPVFRILSQSRQLENPLSASSVSKQAGIISTRNCVTQKGLIGMTVRIR